MTRQQGAELERTCGQRFTGRACRRRMRKGGSGRHHGSGSAAASVVDRSSGRAQTLSRWMEFAEVLKGIRTATVW